MAEDFFLTTQSGIPENRVVTFTFGVGHRGFLLTRQGPAMSPEFFALYPDGVVEEIDPANGTPRPEPDFADRTKGVVIPPSLQSGIPENYKTGSEFSGAVRAVVQSDHSRGQETKLSHVWGKTHGLLEHPIPRAIGVTEFQEASFREQRQFFIIEISSLGVFAAPVKVGADSTSYGVVREYLPSDAQLAANPGWQQYRTELSLWWAYTLGGHSARVQRLLTQAEIAPAYASGAPWTDDIGWAFDIYGRKAANVVQRSVGDGLDFSSIEDYYATRLMELTFTTNEVVRDVNIQLLSPSQAIATSTNHGMVEGQLAIISGADQPEYNGPHVVFNVTTDIFEFFVTGSPSSPATGSVKLVNALETVEVAASLDVGTEGKITFRRHTGGTLWIPDLTDTSNWIGVFPFLNVINGTGPVHVFYDGEDQILTEWTSSTTSVPLFETPPIVIPPIPPIGGVTVFWDGVGHGGIHGHVTESCDPIFACQSGFEFNPDCESCFQLTGPYLKGGSGQQIAAHTNTNHGFFNSAVSWKVDSHSRGAKYATTVDQGLLGVLVSDFGNRYGLCEACWFVRPGVGLITGCGSTIHHENDVHGQLGRRHDVTELKTGTSVAIIFPREREAIAGFEASRIHETGTDYTANKNQLRIGARENKTDAGDCPFTDWELNDHLSPGFIGSPFPQSDPGTSDVDNVLIGGSWALKTVGALRTGGLQFTPDGEVINPDFAGFAYWTKGIHESTQAGLFAMRGGLQHDDPSLEPTSGYIDHRITAVDGVIEIDGGFADLEGKAIIGFVGLV